MIVVCYVLSFVGAVEGAQLPLASGPFFPVSLTEDQEKKIGSSGWVTHQPKFCDAFTRTLDAIPRDAQKEDFMVASLIVGEQPHVLYRCPGISSFLLQYIKSDVRNDAVVAFLGEAENIYFPGDKGSLQRRHDALFYAVTIENPSLVAMLLDHQAPVLGKHDLLKQLPINCMKRRTESARHARSGGYCVTMCTSTTPQPLYSEDSAYEVARLLILKGAPISSAAELTYGIGCMGTLCHGLRKYYKKDGSGVRREKRENKQPEAREYITLEPENPSDMPEDEEELR